jgi:OPA family glycerol-3-phosphate transporter-like MFS transporter 1/2
LNHSDSPVGFAGALKIPGVVEFSLCLFFSKLVNYTFLFWLPLYIKNSSEYSYLANRFLIKFLGFSAPLSPEHSAELSMVFDIGGIVGAILTYF